LDSEPERFDRIWLIKSDEDVEKAKYDLRTIERPERLWMRDDLSDIKVVLPEEHDPEILELRDIDLGQEDLQVLADPFKMELLESGEDSGHWACEERWMLDYLIREKILIKFDAKVRELGQGGEARGQSLGWDVTRIRYSAKGEFGKVVARQKKLR
jgi:hypothetical protein